MDAAEAVPIAQNVVAGREKVANELRSALFQHLRDQGFKLTDRGLIVPVSTDKDSVRNLHAESVAAQRDRAHGALAKLDTRFARRLRAGSDLNPADIKPRLEILPTGRSENALLWRWCSLHWTIPVSSGYGRRIRALVVDEAHGDAVIGLIGLADPVFALGVRDKEIGWSRDQRMTKLASVMDAFVLGAVPPYSHLLGGKLLASLLQSRTLSDAFRERYGHRTTLISERDPDAHLALITTTSALGRSSVYNRVRRMDGSLVLRPVGFTKGSGDFHLSGAIYDRLAAFAMSDTELGESQRHEKWGRGFRNRREVIQKAMSSLGLNSHGMRVHGVHRQVFVSELASNSLAWLRGDDAELDWQTLEVDEIAAWWRTRWAIERSKTDHEWSVFDPSDWTLYPQTH
ncbi:Druantia anti-phage system protein DruA [Microcella pacifica]|uniref:DUF4338 domain-containing protein n=1 Tax=Microcella pacifica TaxID=2591847 RepID=A0A9E5JP72_9MICO|nr:DUF4338 domain-containing protein [Microcella pacifica]